jgi:hypothetical protein
MGNKRVISSPRVQGVTRGWRVAASLILLQFSVVRTAGEGTGNLAAKAGLCVLVTQILCVSLLMILY